MSVVRIYYCDTLVSHFPGVCLSAGVERRPLVVSLHARHSSEPAVYIVHFLRILFCLFSFTLFCWQPCVVNTKYEGFVDLYLHHRHAIYIVKLKDEITRTG